MIHGRRGVLSLRADGRLAYIDALVRSAERERKRISMDAKTLYPLYLDYVQRLRDALTRPGGPEVSERYLIRPMSLADFHACWQHLARWPGRQEALAAKLERGYALEAAEIRQRFEAAFAKKRSERTAA